MSFQIFYKRTLETIEVLLTVSLVNSNAFFSINKSQY